MRRSVQLLIQPSILFHSNPFKLVWLQNTLQLWPTSLPFHVHSPIQRSLMQVESNGGIYLRFKLLAPYIEGGKTSFGQHKTQELSELIQRYTSWPIGRIRRAGLERSQTTPCSNKHLSAPLEHTPKFWTVLQESMYNFISQKNYKNPTQKNQFKWCLSAMRAASRSGFFSGSIGTAGGF